MYIDRTVINTTTIANGGSMLTGTYWSSAENGNNNADFQCFDDGDQGYRNKKSTYIVRAVRAF